MSFSIKYSFPDSMIRNLELISKIDGHLQVLRMNKDWARLLEKNARLEEAVASIGIEGTIVSIDQARAITQGEGTVNIGEKAEREFTSYYESLEFIKIKLEEPLSEALLLKIHEKIVTGNAKALPGKFKAEPNAVKRNKKIIYRPPPVNQISFLIREFLQWFNNTTNQEGMSSVVAAAICHFWFVWIHPFADGNGRVARLLTTFLLLKKKAEGIKYFALSDYYNKNQKAYYDALERVNVCDPLVPAMNFTGDLTSWISFFTESYLGQADNINEVTNRILQLNIRVEHLRRQGLITEKQNKALSLLHSRDRASYVELQKHLGDVTPGRVTQILKPLRAAKILIEEKIGKQIWFKLGSPEEEPKEETFEKKLKRTSSARGFRKSKKISKQAVLPIFEK